MRDARHRPVQELSNGAQIDRRRLLAMATAAAASPAIARAAAIDARVRTGTIRDVEHVVILMQENRSFDHYFGTMNGVRGFADRFPVPLPGGRSVWAQASGENTIAPFPLDTAADFDLMRVQGTPHGWSDAQVAWDHGRIGHWPQAKTPRSMAHYRAADLPFQFALADAFTLCDAYHCSIQTGTNTNRLFLWTGTNDPQGRAGGPCLDNSHDTLPPKGAKEPYAWTTYVERLQAAGVTWRHYQDMADLFSDNPLVGFKAFRDSLAGAPGSDPQLAERALTSRSIDQLRADVLSGALPQVSYIISTAAESEHPGPSSPPQGADFTARVIDALTADPDRWSRTVLLVMFDENDGFFDHMPPPAPPSMIDGEPAGGSTVDTAGEYHLHRNSGDPRTERAELMGRPYGLGARAPMYVVSPWSRGGWVNSQVFDHTSVIRFLEARFGVMEPNISPWRRTVCGDLTSAFDFRTPNRRELPGLPSTKAAADRAHAIARQPNPAPPADLRPPVQAAGPRPSRALPYNLDVAIASSPATISLRFINEGAAGAVFHVYDRTDLAAAPRRYTVEAGKSLEGHWPGSADLWVLGPNGFHRHVRGDGDATLKLDPVRMQATVTMANGKQGAFQVDAGAGPTSQRVFDLKGKRGWYDVTVRSDAVPTFVRRFAGRLENGKDSISDPAMAGPALMGWT